MSRGLAPNDFVPVPNLIGLFYNEALEKIESSNLKKGSTKFVDYEKSVPNIILNQSPKKGNKNISKQQNQFWELVKDHFRNTKLILLINFYFYILFK
ncbi:MAG: hypothetical protein Ct9H90mP15_08640 [Candidatus Neomarinimicrobiota bacterium]|nr:MAG: hypothetical protein Ct9H90mP15_08640 [Candidatus Neomarinimicrobiota bacterium]